MECVLLGTAALLTSLATEPPFDHPDELHAAHEASRLNPGLQFLAYMIFPPDNILTTGAVASAYYSGDTGLDRSLAALFIVIICLYGTRS